jgi:hypothetical protein
LKQTISYLVFFILSSYTLFAQQGTFLRIYTGGSYEEGIAAFHLPDNTYRLIGNTGSYGWGNTNVWFLALDSNANFMWHKTFGIGGLDKAEAAVMDENGNIFIIGTSSSQSGMGYQMFLMGVDSVGTRFTHKYYGGSDWDFGHSLCIVNDSLLMLAGESYSYGNGQGDAWMLLAKINGDSIWSKTIGGAKNDAFLGVNYKSNFGFTFIGKSKSVGNGSFNPFVYHTNYYGDSIWYWSRFDTTDGGFNDLAITSDADIVVVGYQRDSSDLYNDVSVVKLDNNGNLLWNRLILRYGEESNYSSVILSGDTIVATGYTTAYGHGEKDIDIIQLKNKGGWWIRNVFIGRKKSEYAYSINKDTIGGIHYLVVGSTDGYDLTHTGIIFMRTNSDLLCDTTPIVDVPSNFSSINKNKMSISIFPNPVIDEIYISITSQNSHNPVTISLVDAFGKLLYYRSIARDIPVYRLDVSNLSSGVYFVIYDDGINSIRKKVIKQ